LKLKLNYEYFPTMGNTHSLALALKCEDIYWHSHGKYT
jgi:hypothetical protein